jgi:hypothetical protein
MTPPISSAKPSSAQGVEQALASGTPKSPTLTGPALNPGQPRMLALGLEGLIALLSEEGAKQMRKDARENQRAERDTQLAAIQRQVSELHAKADAMRSEALVTMGLSVAGGAAQFAGACGGAGAKSAPKWANATDKGGTTLSQVSGPMGKLAYGGQQIEHDANATRAAADAKRAESAAEEYGALLKNADSTIDKAHQALQALVQLRAQLNANHGVYRAM